MEGFRVRRAAAVGILALLPAALLAGDPSGSSSGHRSPRVSLRASSLEGALDLASRRSPAPQSGLSISIVELATGQPVFERNAEAPQTIASVTKLFSTAAALHFLGPDYRFKTTFWRRGEVQDGLLVGSLLVVGGGDPSISGRFYDDDYNAVFDKWAEGLRRLGILRVSGDLILNASRFDSVSRNPEWHEGQESRWYQAPISALSYNDNVVIVSIGPGSRPGRPASVSIEPQTDLLRPVSWARTVSRGRTRLAVRREFGSGDVMVSGTVPYRGWWSTPIAIDDAPGFFGAALRGRLQNTGITVVGNIVKSPVEPDNSWTLVAETESALLPALAVTNKRSQGFYAEQVFKTLGAEKAGVGTWPNALAAEKEFLTEIGLDPARYHLHDGSGLSPENRVAAADVVKFLRAMDGHTYGSQWKATLAVSGEPEGTLRHRLRDSFMQGRVVGKTGSIHGVSTLAGYVTASSGKVYIFSIFLNGPRVWDSNGHAYQDRIVRALARHG